MKISWRSGPHPWVGGPEQVENVRMGREVLGELVKVLKGTHSPIHHGTFQELGHLAFPLRAEPAPGHPSLS